MSFLINPYVFAPGGGATAFPSLINTAKTSASAITPGVRDWDINLPADILENDILLVFGGTRDTTVQDWSFPSGWAKLLGANHIAVFWKRATGAEGSTVTASVEEGARRFAMAKSVRAVSTGSDPEGGIGALDSFDPPSLSPSWGSDKTKWVAGVGGINHSSVPTAPTDYTDLDSHSTSGSGDDAFVAVAFRNLEAASEDPGAFSDPGMSNDRAFTLALRGA
ncbi:MAG: hypothetical protein WD178_02260 [Actinomycetota bacterium]